MAETTGEPELEAKPAPADALTQKMKKAAPKANAVSVKKFLTPFKVACLAMSLLISFNIIWAYIFGNALGGQPIATLDINWTRPEPTEKFVPDFANSSGNDKQFVQNNYQAGNGVDLATKSQQEMPRITASDSSKIIHLPTEMAEAKPEGFESTGKLPRAPIEDVVQFSKYGKLPKIGVLGERPSEVYARPAPAFDGRPRIAIMITGLGIHQEATKNAIDGLPGEISFAFSPYGNGLQDWIHRARDMGHEVVLQTPMEPFDYPDNDPGPSTLLAEGEVPVNMSRFRWIMSRITGYIGITNFMGAKFTSKEKAVAPILRELERRGLYYIENGVSHRSKVAKLSKQMGLGYSKADIIIDEKKTVEDIENSLERIERIATTTGMAFAVGSNYPATIEHLKIWVNTLEAKGYQLIPVSAKVKKQLRTNVASGQ